MMQQPTHPVQLSVDYPDRALNRLTTFFRIFVAIPIMIILIAVSGVALQSPSNGRETVTTIATTGGLLFLGPLLMILFRRKYPRWWFEWNLALMRFSYRVTVY